MSTSTMLERPTPPTMRNRTKTLQMHSESDSPSSQLPSPRSSVDDNLPVPDVRDADFDTVLATPTPHSRLRRSSASTQASRRTKSHRLASAEETADAQWSDIPLAVALIPPLGSFLTGGDFLRDFLLFILLFFYLHQLIKLPWELYLASRPRRRRILRTDMEDSDEMRLHDLAASELRTAEFCYLALAVFAPLLGAALLRFVGTVLTGRDYISWFSTGIFVLVTGVRPWRHLGRRLRGRTEELQEMVHGTMRADHFEERIKQLESDLAALRESVALREDVATLDGTLQDLHSQVTRQSYAAEAGRRATDERFKMLERTMDGVRVADSKWMFAPSFLLDWMRPQAVALSRAPHIGGPRSAPRVGYHPRLASVREEDSDGTSMRQRTRSRSKSIPLTVTWVEMALVPLRAGRRLVWLILDFLKHSLV